MMRRSFVRLIVSSVLACWAISFAVLVIYVLSRSWTRDQARRAGVYLAHELLDRHPAAERAARLPELRAHFSVDLALLPEHEVGRRVGRRLAKGESILYAESPRRHWCFVAFSDGRGALAAGPVDPSVPTGALPIGILLAIFGLPLIAGLVTVRVEHRLRRVERASRALAEGDLDVRVADQHASADELAASFNAMAERVGRLVRSRDELVQAVSHELGSPLSRLRFQLELLDGQSEEKRRERLGAMTRELDALDELVAELLTYVQSDDLELARETFDPQKGLTDLVELATLEAPEEGAVEVELAIPPALRVFADPRLFQRAIENILRNALRHAEGRVRLELHEEAASTRVVVHDNGSGIPEALREQVKTPFYRVAADRDRKTGGVGLGLAIVGRIVERHGGRLEIGDSPLGGAAIATVWPSEARDAG